MAVTVAVEKVLNMAPNLSAMASSLVWSTVPAADSRLASFSPALKMAK